MSSLRRLLDIFNAFSVNKTTLTLEEVMDQLQCSQGTAYRYIRELVDFGFLSRVGGNISLGPRIIELDYYIRQNDPHLQNIQALLRDLSSRYNCDVLLTSFYEDRVVVRAHERARDALTMSYGRGRRMPLFRGAGSKAILAALPTAWQNRLYSQHQDEIAKAGLGLDWKSFRSTMNTIRRAGFVISYGELDQGNVGVAAPVFPGPQPNPPGSLVVVFDTARFSLVEEAAIGRLVIDYAKKIDSIFSDDII